MAESGLQSFSSSIAFERVMSASLSTRHRGYIPLWLALLIATITVFILTIWTIRSMSPETSDGRETIVFWGAQQLGEDIYAVVNQFEKLPENLDEHGKPRYKVIVGT